MTEENIESALAPKSYPIYFERALGRIGASIRTGALILAFVIGTVFVVSDLVARTLTADRLIELMTLLLSLALGPIFLIIVRDRTVVAFQSISLSLDAGQEKELHQILSKVFDQRTSLKFASVVALGGIAHHITLSYFQWGRIWWYSMIDIALVGFLWWFVIATFLWTCLSVSAYSFVASKRLKFTLPISSRGKMLGLEGYGTLAVFPAILWGVIATLGTATTFDPFISAQFPGLILLYLLLDFVISALSMTAVFLLPILGYRRLVIPFKRELSKQLRQLISESGPNGIPSTPNLDPQKTLNTLYLWELSSQIEEIREWPLSVGAGLKFVVSYLIPGSVFVGRLIYFYTYKVPLPI
jgi:hypothetical protein